MFDDLFNWLLFFFGPLGVALMLLSAAIEPLKKAPETEQALPDPDGSLRAITALLVVLAVARTQAEQVQGRRTGLSERAFPFGQTERRAKRTLDRPPP